MFVFNAFLSDNSCGHLLKNNYFTTCFPYVQNITQAATCKYVCHSVYLDGTYPIAFTQLFPCGFPGTKT